MYNKSPQECPATDSFCVLGRLRKLSKQLCFHNPIQGTTMHKNRVIYISRVPYNPVLRIRIRDPVPFCPWIGIRNRFFPDPGSRIPNPNFLELGESFLGKNLFFSSAFKKKIRFNFVKVFNF
jgi:hypothetical protein